VPLTIIVNPKLGLYFGRWSREDNEFDFGYGGFRVDLRYWIGRSIYKSEFQSMCKLQSLS
jgi:hypothetical protein